MGQIPSIELSEYDNTPNEGTDINVTATITSKSPLLSLKWVVIGGTGVNLPSSATTTNYSTVIGIVGVTHSILSLHSLSRNDSGNYSIVATNECGTQIASVNIKVEEVAPKCTTTENPPPGTIIKPPPTDIVTVQGESLQISCLALAALSDNLYNFWNITLHSSVINVHDNSSDLYHINVYQTDAINCTLNNKLIINTVSRELHGAVLTCIEGIKVRGIGHIVTLSASNATLGVYGYPKVLNISVWPSNTGIKAGDNVTLQCQLKAAPLMYTEVEWLQNGSLVNKMKHHEVEKGGHILSILNITDFTQKDGGNYTCKCHYDRSKVITKNDIVSNQMSVVIYAEGNNNVHGKHTQKLLIIRGVTGGLVTATCLISLAVLIVVLHIRYCSGKWWKKKVIEWSATNHDDGPLVQVTSPSQASQNHNGYDDITSEQEESGTPVQEESSGHVTPSCTPNAATPLLHAMNVRSSHGSSGNTNTEHLILET